MSPRRTQHSQQVVEGFQKKLSTEHFAILMAASVDGTYQTIAAVFPGLPMGTIKSRLNRARLALEDLIAKEKLEKEGYFVEWNGECFQSVFPSPEAAKSKLHTCVADALDYMTDECGVDPEVIEVRHGPSEAGP